MAPLLLALALGLIAVGSLVALTRRVEASRDAEVTLAQVETELNRLQGIPWSLLNAHPPTAAEVRRQLADSESRIDGMLAQLRRRSPLATLSSVTSGLESNYAVNAQILTAVAAGRVARTGGLAASAGRTLVAVERSLKAAGDQYRAASSTAKVELISITSAVIVILLVAFALFYRRSLKAQRAAQTLAEEMRDLAFELRGSEAHLREAQRLAGVGSWSWNVADEAFSCSEEAARLHGWTNGGTPTRAPQLYEQMAAEDREPVRAALQKTLQGGPPASVDYRINGRLIHLEAQTTVDERGEATGLVGTCQDITERFRRAQAERANQAKNEFISRMSHELRTPLNAILGFGQLLQDGEADQRTRENAGHIVSAGKHLLDLINEILDLSRIEAGQLRLSPEPVNVGGVITETVDLIEHAARERDLKVAITIPEFDLWAKADTQRVRQVLLNLLSNAVKYNRDGGRIQVSAERAANDRVRIVVTDDGPGIAASLVKRLFTPFERLGAEHTAVEGTGLGLALCERMVEVMGGTIAVETSPGAGSSFIVELQSASPPSAEALDAGQGDVDHAEPDVEIAHKVLCVEDNHSNLELLRQVFDARPSIALLTATGGEAGLALARAEQPDLVLLDLGLPDIPGDQILSRLKSTVATATIPVLILSADASESQRNRLLALGAHAYLAKPIDIAHLLRTVDDVLTGARRAA